MQSERLTFEEGFRKNSSLVVDNEDMHVYHIYMKTNGRKYLRCCTTQCPGKAIVSANNEIKVSTQHTHPGGQSVVSERRFVVACKRRAENETTSLREIFNTESVRYSIDPSTTFAYRESGLFKRRKNAPTNVPSEPAELASTILQNARLRADVDGDLWFRAHLSDESAGDLLIFASDLGCRILSVSAEMHVEVSTNVVPSMFAQLCTVHASAFGKVFACVYGLMSLQCSEAIEMFLDHVKSTLCSAAAPSVIMLDTELDGMKVAVAKVFPTARLLGCWFHYTRAVWRQCVHNGLAAAYHRPPVSQLIRMTVCLPLLPNHNIAEGFEVLQTYVASSSSVGSSGDGVAPIFEASEIRGARALFEYLAEHWLNEAERLSVYGQPRRTGCAVSLFAANLRTSLGAEPDIWTFMDKLKKIDKQERTEHQRVSQKQNMRPDRINMYVLHDRRVIQATMRLEDGTDSVQQFLSGMADAVGSGCVDSASQEIVELGWEHANDEQEEDEADRTVEATTAQSAHTSGFVNKAEKVAEEVAESTTDSDCGADASTEEVTTEMVTITEMQTGDHDYTSMMPAPETSARLTFEEGARRNSTVVVDNVDHHIYSVYGRLRGRMYLRCLTPHCSARGVAYDGDITVSKGHTHPGNELAIRERRFSTACKRRAELESTSLREILETESQKFNIRAPDGNDFAHKRTMHRRRKGTRENAMPQTAAQLADSIGTTPRWLFTGDREPWFRAHLTGLADAGEVIVFLSENGHRLLGAEELHVDVMETSVPHMFAQLCTIHAAGLGNVYPCLFALMTRKTLSAYQMLMHHLTSSLCPQLNPSTVLLDRSDQALTEAVATTFPTATLAVTWFNFSRSVWSTWRQQQHQQNIVGSTNREVLNMLKMTVCLPLLRSTDLDAALQSLEDTLTFLPDVQPAEVAAVYNVLEHVRRWWLGEVGAANMSVFGQPRRTSNHVEIFRNWLRARMGFTPEIWEFLDKLMKMERRTRDDYQRATNGGTQRRDFQTRHILLDKKVILATSKLEDGSSNVEEFLTKCAQVIGTSGDEWIPPDVAAQLMSAAETQAAGTSMVPNQEDDDDVDEVISKMENRDEEAEYVELAEDVAIVNQEAVNRLSFFVDSVQQHL